MGKHDSGKTSDNPKSGQGGRHMARTSASEMTGHRRLVEFLRLSAVTPPSVQNLDKR